MSTTKTEILEALVATYVAEEKTAGTNLNNYLNNAAGIGEHPDIVAEAKKLVEKIGSARANRDLVKSML
tara:strand:- start:1363 stop:1569 length:207 start_codon:yes stop_codon:yes gene_type:complete